MTTEESIERVKEINTAMQTMQEEKDTILSSLQDAMKDICAVLESQAAKPAVKSGRGQPKGTKQEFIRRGVALSDDFKIGVIAEVQQIKEDATTVIYMSEALGKWNEKQDRGKRVRTEVFNSWVDEFGTA